MKIEKPTEADKEFFLSLVPDGVDVKPMFGNLAAFVNGNMFMGLFGADVGLRLNENDRNRLRAETGAADFGPEGRPMKEYVSIPRGWRNEAHRTDPWIELALAHVGAMPPKAKKPKK